MTSKRGKRKNMAHEAEPSVLLMFLPLFFNMYDLSTDPRQQGIFLFYARKKKHNSVDGDVIYVSVL